MDAQAEYDNRARVPEHPAIIAGWARDAGAFRAGWPHADLGVTYGLGERERLDLFFPAAEDHAGPGALFLHGGYWQALDRSFFSHMARGLLARGVAVAVPSFDLCPGVPLARIVAQARAAAALAQRRFGGRPLLAAGHSAGGHLAATLMATDWRGPARRALPHPAVTAALPISGVFELDPLLPTTIGAPLRLTPAEARALSPRWMPRPATAGAAALHVAVGGDESAEFLRQSRDFALAWGGGYEVLPGRNHFTVLDPFTDPASPLVARAAAMATATAGR